jgi:uncharacterized membrane protein HdeD (DUF308 family)
MPSKDEKLRQVASSAKQRVDSKLGKIWWSFMLRGLLALALSACALFWPQKTMGLMIKLLGAYFIIDGLAGAVSAFRAESKGVNLMQVVVSLAIGLVLLFWTGVSAKLFLIVVGIWALLQGVGMYLSSRGLESEDEQRGLMGIIGAVMAVIGLVLIFWPNTGVVTISWLIALGSLIIGGLLIYLATRLKRVKKRINDIGT